jgi:hypothetical protein
MTPFQENTMKTSARLTRIAALLSSLMLGSLAHADILGWQTFGDVAALSGSPAGLSLPITGNTLVLSTATLGPDDFPFADGHYNLSGQAAGVAGFTGGLEDFVGLAPGALDTDTVLWEGSAIQQTWSVHAGDTLHFNWNLLSADRDMADLAFLVIDTHTGGGPLVQSLGEASLASQAVTGNSDLLQTGATSFSHTFSTAGLVTVSLAVADRQDGDKTTLLALDHVQLSSAVPEPDAVVLALLGLGTAGLLTRTRTRRVQGTVTPS